MAVAGISSPLDDFRSPFSVARTTSRSAVSRTSDVDATGLRARGFFGFATVGFLVGGSAFARGIRAGV